MMVASGQEILPPFLCRTSLQPGESLISLVVRLAERNGYESPSMVARLCLTGESDTGLICPPDSVVFAHLANLTMLDPEQLYQATPHRFADVFTPPQIKAPSLLLPTGKTVLQLPKTLQIKHLRPMHAGQFCPCCLQEAAYHRLIWTPTAVATCLQHQCLLINECFICRQHLSVREIVARTCCHCGADLRKAPLVDVSQDTLGNDTQQIIQACLSGAETFKPASLGLPFASPAVLHHIMEGLRTTVMKSQPGWPYLHTSEIDGLQISVPRRGSPRLTPVESYLFYATARKALLDWPKGFYEFLHSYRMQREPPGHRGLSSDFGYLHQCFQRLWQHSSFQCVQDVFNQYLLDHYPRSNTIIRSARYRSDPAFAQRFAYISVAETASLLGMYHARVHDLINSGALKAYPSQDYHLSRPFMKRAEVLAYRRQTQFISLAKAAKTLNVSPFVVIELGNFGLLEAERDPQTTRWIFRDSSIRKLFHQLEKHVPDAVLNPPSKPTVDWTTAIKILSDAEISPAHLVRQVVQGKLPTYCYLVYPNDLNELHFIEPDFRAWIESTRLNPR